MVTGSNPLFNSQTDSSQLQRELSELRERLFELEDLEISRVSEEQERFDALQVLDEYAKQLEDSRDKLTRLFKAANDVQEARTIQEALQRIAEAVQDAGWGSVSVSLFKNWQVVQAAYAGCTREDIDFLESNRRAPAERARQYGPEFERFIVNRSYFVPAEELPGLIAVDTVCPGRREVQPGDEWNPMDLAYVPLVGSGGRVIGCINCDDPTDGRRPGPDTYTYLELFADIAASKVETTRLIEQQRRTAEAYRESEEKYRTLFSRSGDGYILMDQQIRDCNQKICEILQMTRQDLLGSSFATLAAQAQSDGRDSAEAARQMITRAMNDGSLSCAWQLRRKDGAIVHSELTLSNVEIGGEALLLAVVRDVSDKRRTEAALEESERRFRIAADAASLLIWMSDQDMTMSFFNLAWQEYTGREAVQLCGLGWEADIHPDELAALKHAVENVHANHCKSEVEFRLKRRDGQYRWFVNVAAPRFDAIGDFLGMVGTCIEIHQRVVEIQNGEAIRQVSKLLLSTETMSAAYQELPAILNNWCALPIVSIELRDTASAELVRVAQSGYPDSAARRTALSDSPPSTTALTGETSIQPAVSLAGDAKATVWAAAQNIEAYICVPITLKNRVLGVLTLADHCARNDLEDFVKPLGIIADSLAQAIERRRAEVESERLAAFQRENPNLAIACDSRGNVTYVNPTGINLLREYNLHLFPGLLPPDHKPLIRKCVAENTVIHEIVTRVGERDISWSYYNIPSVQTVHLIGIDITRQLKMERDLAAWEQRRKAIVKSAPDCIIVVDERGNIVSLNTAAEALLALHDSDACGESFIHTAIAVSERERLSSELEGILQLNHKPEESRRLCTRIVRGGAEFAAEVTLVPDPMPGITQLLVWIRELS